MADTTTKNLRIVWTGDSGSVVKSMEDVKTSVEAAGGQLTSFKEIIDTATGKIKQYITVGAETVDILQKIAAEQKALGTETYKVTNAIVSQSASIVKANKEIVASEKEVEKAMKASADSRGYTRNASGTVGNNRATVAEALAKQQQEEYALVQKGIDARLQAEQRRNDELTRLETLRLNAQASYARQTIADEEQLANRLRQIDNTRIEEAAKASAALIAARDSAQAGYAQQGISDTVGHEEAARARTLTALRADIEARNSAAVQANAAAANLFRQQSQQEVTELDRRIALETSIRRNGATNVQTIALQGAQAEARIREQLAAQLISIEERIRSGALTSAQGASARATATNQYSTAMTENSRALDENARAAGGAIQAHRSLGTHIAEVIGIYRIYNAVINYTQQALMAIPKAGIDMQATKSNLLGIFGSEEGGKDLKFISDLADSAGQNILTLEQAYARFAPSAALAGATQKDINKSFKDFAEVGTILHLTDDKLNSVFLALDQMYAKGVVQSEEIKKQLGNVLPGAVEVGAKAMHMSSSAFMEAMKKNQVTAEEFVPKFAKIYRETFGGKDDSVFTQTKDKLLSNLHRIETEYVRVNRSIFSSTEETMNSVAKSVANALESVRTNLTGIGQGLELFSELLIGRLGVGLVTSLGSVVGIVSKLVSIIPILTGVSNPVAAAITGIAAAGIALYGGLNNLSVAYNSTTGFMVKFQEQQVTLTSYIDAVASLAIDKLRNSFNDFFSFHTTGDDWSNWLSEKFALVIHPIDTLRMAMMQLAAAKDALFSTESLTSPTSIGDRYTANLQKLVEADKVTVGEFNKAALELAKQKDEAKKKPTEQEIPAQLSGGIPNEITGKVDKAALAAHKKDVSAFYKDLERDSKFATQSMQRDLDELDLKYKENEVSIATYYDKKYELMQKDLEHQADNLLKAQTKAQAEGDVSKNEAIVDKLNDLISQSNSLDRKKVLEKNKDLEDYNNTLKTTNAEYEELLGHYAKAEELRYSAKNSSLISRLQVEGNTTDLSKVRDIEHANTVNRVTTAASKTAKLAQDDYNAAIQKTNILKNIGIMSELQAAVEMQTNNQKLIKAKQAEIDEIQKAIELEKEKIAVEKGDPNVLNQNNRQLNKAKDDLENLKLEANSIAGLFTNKLGNALVSPLANFIDGAMNAKTAFKSFSISVQQEIASIVADLLKAMILKQIMGIATTALGMFGGGGIAAAGDAAGASVGNASLAISAQGAPFANGGVLSSKDLSRYSGTMVNTPTFFKFASGGGVMGEAGPEAILPLKRNANGKLGVVAHTGDKGHSSSGGGVNVGAMHITLQAAPDSSPQQQSDMIAKTVRGQLSALIQQQTANNLRSGGLLNPTQLSVGY